MKTVQRSSFDDFLKWYLRRESLKANGHGVPSLFEERLELMKRHHSGKFLEWFPIANWSIVSLDLPEFKNLVYLDSPWTREAGLTNQTDGPNYRLLCKVAQNAINTKYMESDDPDREPHRRYYRLLRDGELNLKDDRLVLRELDNNESRGNPDGTSYLHDGNGRALPYLILIMEKTIPFQPVEAFFASRLVKGGSWYSVTPG